LFEDYEKQPPQLRRILEKYEKKYEEGDMDYAETAKMQKEVEKIGYTFDSGLDNEPFGLRPIGIKLGQLRGYEGEKSDNDTISAFDEFAKGGRFRTRNKYRQKQDDRLVYFVKEDKVEDFLRRYPKVEQSMLDYSRRYKTLSRAYANWLNWMNRNEAELGGRAETISAPSFGVKTFYKYDWNGVDGWAEIMQYIYTKKR